MGFWGGSFGWQRAFMRSWMLVAAWMMGTCAGTAKDPGTAGDLLAAQPTLIGAVSPTIHIGLDGVRVRIVFTGTLQSADAVCGPWNDVANAASPFNEDSVNRQRYYRTREPDSIFLSRSVVAITLTGPFQSHFDLALAGTPDGFIPPRREKPYFEETLKLTGYEIPVTLRHVTAFFDALASVTR
jgi:hypothetical protein